MRITVVTGFFLPVPAVRGGATEKIWYGLAQHFAAEGHPVAFVSRQWPGQANAETENAITHIRVAGFDHSRSLVVNLLRDFLWGVRVTRALPPADVLICNTIALPVWISWVKPAAGLVAVMIGRMPKGQTAFYRGVRRLYVPSSSVADRLPRSIRGRTVITGYPIECSRLGRAARQTGTPVVVGFVGRLHPEKGIALLLAAAERLAARGDLPPWRLKLVGPTGIPEGGGGVLWAERLRRTTAGPLAERLEWLPAEFDPERLAAHYGSMDIFCYPSLAEHGETFGVAVAEAMAAGCAAVVSTLPCFRDLVTDNQTGFTFDPSLPEAGAQLEAILGRLIGDGPRRRGVAARGQAHVQRFDYPQVTRALLDDLAFLRRPLPEKPQSSPHA